MSNNERKEGVKKPVMIFFGDAPAKRKMVLVNKYKCVKIK